MGFSLLIKWMEDECVRPPPKRRGKQLDPLAASEDACTYIYICRQTHKRDHPVLGQPTDKAHHPHCLCTMCVVAQPPDFLVGSSAASMTNVSKRYSLYRLLQHLEVWKHPTYLE